MGGQKLYANTSTSLGKQLLNPAAFANPAQATSIEQTDASPLGGVGQQAHGPDYDNIDLSMFKRFQIQITERLHLEFRAEAFNAINHPNFSDSFRSLDFRITQYFGVMERAGIPATCSWP